MVTSNITEWDPQPSFTQRNINLATIHEQKCYSKSFKIQVGSCITQWSPRLRKNTLTRHTHTLVTGPVDMALAPRPVDLAGTTPCMTPITGPLSADPSMDLGRHTLICIPSNKPTNCGPRSSPNHLGPWHKLHLLVSPVTGQPTKDLTVKLEIASRPGPGPAQL